MNPISNILRQINKKDTKSKSKGRTTQSVRPTLIHRFVPRYPNTIGVIIYRFRIIIALFL